MNNGHTVGVIIGRFQLAHLHKGHISFIRHVLAKEDTCCILVGCTPTPNLKNLVPFQAVAQMIRSTFKTEHDACKLHVFPLMDVLGDDKEWSANIDAFLGAAFPFHSITMYAGRDSYKTSYHGEHPVVDWYGFDGNVNGTQLRNNIMLGDPLNSYDFRAGIIYGLGNYLRAKGKK